MSACAGTAGHFHVLPLVSQWTKRAADARKVLVAWLAGNLFLGSQICWVLRSFIWDSARPTRFIGREYFRGTFYETLFEAVKRLLF